MKNFSILITVLVLTALTMTSCGSQYPDAHPTTTKFTPPLISQHTTPIAPTNLSPTTKTTTNAPGSVTWTTVNNLNLVYFIHAVWGSSPSNVFAVGAGGNILHYDGKEWSSMLQSTPEDLLAIWGSSATDVFAVGVGGTIIHYDGKGWSMNMNVIPGMTGDLSSVWGSSSSDVYAVGSQSYVRGFMLHYNGKEWSTLSTDANSYFGAVWGSSATDVFVAGSGGIVHYDGMAWSKM